MRCKTLILSAMALLAVPTLARADVAPEVRAGFYSDAEEGFVGGGVLAPMSSFWYFNPNMEWVFVESVDYFTVNADFHRDLNPGDGPAVWLGGGPALVVVDRDPPTFPSENDTDVDLGVNLLGGVGGKYGAVRPFGQAKVLFSDQSEMSLALGLRF